MRSPTPRDVPEPLGRLLDLVGLERRPEERVAALGGLLLNTLDAVTHPLYIIDVTDYRVVVANGAAGLHPLGRDSTCYAVTHGHEKPCGELGFDCPLKTAIATSAPATAEHVHLDQQGRARICEVHCYPVVGSSGRVTHVIEHNLDVTERKDAQEQLRLLGTAIKTAANAIFVTDRDGRIQWVNDAFCRLCGYSREEVVGELPKLLKSGLHDDAFYRQMWETILRGEVWRGRLINRHRDGSLLIVEQTITPLTNSQGEIANFVVVHDDLTARAEAERRLHHAARFDYLTDLPNRHTFNDRVDQVLERMVAGSQIGVLLLDLDRFREINETFGQTVGDALLLSVSARLRGVVRQVDLLARAGSDEFCILQADGGHVDRFEALARRLLSALEPPFEVADRRFHLTATIGIALGDTGPAEKLLQEAEIALYRAKVEDPGGFGFYQEEVERGVRSRKKLAFDLRGALERREIYLEYQPQVDIASRRMLMTEALLRWNHPVRGSIAPSEFIDLAERSGLIEPISEWALRAACLEARHWLEETGSAVTMAVNVSAHQLRKSGFSRGVASALEEVGWPPDRLELEVTEWVLMQETPAVLENIRALRELGVSLALDDFGSGYSSIESLQRCPVQTLKIGQHLVEGIQRSDSACAIVSALLRLARRLGLRHVVEGIESEEQLRLVRKEGCEVAQGFYFSHPVPPEEIRRLITSGSDRIRSRV